MPKFGIVLLVMMAVAVVASCSKTEKAYDAEDARGVWEYKAITLKDPEGMFRYGETFCCGDQEPFDTAKAVEWVCEAARKGYAPAQAYVGDLFSSDKPSFVRNPQTLPVDDELAFAWYSVAAKNRLLEARDRQYELGNRLSNEQLMKAKSYVGQFPVLPCEILAP